MIDPSTDLEPAAGREVDPTFGDEIAVTGDDSRPSSGPTARSGRRRIDRGLLIASLVIAGGLVLIIWGVGSAITGDDGIDRPDAIESLSRVENAIQVLQQERIVIDFEFGYEAEMIVDGIAIPTSRIGEFGGEVEPGQQLSIPPTAVFDPGNARLEFQPTDGAPIESFSEGRHQVRVIFWPIDEGRESASSYAWSFDVI